MANQPRRPLFGVANADHQCEAYVPEWADVTDRWEAQEAQNGVQQRGNATNFWVDFGADIKRAARLGCDLFRFSIAWSRVETAPGKWDLDNIRHYRQLVDEIINNGMQPVVTLMHGTWPIHVEDTDEGIRGGAFPDRFRAYARAMAGALPKVRYWITVNEPNMLAFCFLKPPGMKRFPRAPGLPIGDDIDEQFQAVAALYRNLFLANAAGYDEIHAQIKDAVVTANPYILGFPDSWHWLLGDELNRDPLVPPSSPAAEWLLEQAAEQLWRVEPNWAKAVHSALLILSGHWWHVGMKGGLPKDQCPEGCSAKQDVVSFDYYWGFGSAVALEKLPALVEGRYADSPVHAPGLLHVLKYCRQEFPEQGVWLMENGCVETADGYTRADYLATHLGRVRAAIDDGVSVEAFICWSITTNREWGLPAGPGTDFGLFRVDLKDPDLVRTKTPAATTYEDIIKGWSGAP